MIKHISFDVWNTLITANPAYAEARTQVIANVGEVTQRKAGETYREVKKFLDKQAEGQVCGTTADSWHLLARVLGLKPGHGDMMKYYAEIEFLHYAPVFDVALAAQLVELSKTFEMSIKSNTNFISGEVLAKACEFEDWDCFDFMHFSDKFRLCKPDVLFFAHTLLSSEDEDLDTSEVLHVGDNLICDGKCVDFGMQFCHVSNPQDLLNKILKGELINA